MTPSMSAEPRRPKPVLNVPAYFLYGEDWTAESFGFFHIEPLSERNLPNQWHIGLHIHPDFDQLSIVVEGDCTFEHDGTAGAGAGPCCVYTPANVVHQFSYLPGSVGYVISFSPDFLESVTFGDGSARTAAIRLSSTRLVQCEQEPTAGVERLTTLLADCQASRHRYRRETLRYLFGALLLQLDDLSQGGEEKGPDLSDGSDLFQRFSEYVEREIGALCLTNKAPEAELTTEAFAARLSTTPYALNLACGNACARSAREIIQASLLGQATRLLLYTSRSVKEIAYGLGYSHPSHFGRFFKRHRQTTPELFRQRYAPHVLEDVVPKHPTEIDT